MSAEDGGVGPNRRTDNHDTTHHSQDDTISSKVNQDSQVVLLTDALSVLQAMTNNKLPQLEQALHNIKCLRTVLQWIPSHCGVKGNEEADKMAKLGAKGEQQNNPISLKEMKSSPSLCTARPSQKTATTG